MSNERHKNDGKIKSFIIRGENWAIIIGVFIILVAICVPFAIIYKLGWIFTYKQFEKLGVVGDFFGGTTVGLFTLASIIFVIAAIVMQKKELELQRKELAQTREEFKTGNTTAKVQQVDNAFFNMLSLHHQIVNNIRTTKGTSSNAIIGREAISYFLDRFELNLAFHFFNSDDPEVNSLYVWNNTNRIKQQYLEKIHNEYDVVSQELLDDIYANFTDEYGNHIGHYMRNNYRIVKFIVNNVAENEEEQKKIIEETGREPIIADKKYYFGMLRAQWSNAEYELIMINALHSKNIKFKNLIIKYDVLDIQDKSAEEFKLKKNSIFKAYRRLIEA